MKRLLDRLSDAAAESAKDGLSLGAAAATVVHLGLDMMIRHLGNEGTVIMLRRIADGLEGPAPPRIPDLINMNPEGSA